MRAKPTELLRERLGLWILDALRALHEVSSTGPEASASPAEAPFQAGRCDDDCNILGNCDYALPRGSSYWQAKGLAMSDIGRWKGNQVDGHRALGVNKSSDS